MTARAAHDMTTAMVLAAGLGRRLWPITATLPKPLIEVSGKPVIDHVLDRLAAAGIGEAVVNTHHLAGQVQAHLAARDRPAIRVLHEPELLGTGRGILRALPWLGRDRFCVAHADVLWLDGPTPAIDRLAEVWDDGRMDALLLVIATPRAFGVDGMGDFYLDAHGRILDDGPSRVRPYYFAGVQIIHPRLFRDAPDGPFNLRALWRIAMAAGRLWGVVHDGAWFHVGSTDGLEEVRAQLADGHLRWVDT